MEVKPFPARPAAGVQVQPPARPAPPPPPGRGEFTRPAPPPAGTDRMQDLEKKLDTLMRELESLRKELKR